MTTIPIIAIWLSCVDLPYNVVMKLLLSRFSITGLAICLVASVVWTEAYLAQRNVLGFKRDWQSRGVKIYYLIPLVHPGFLSETLAPVIIPELTKDSPGIFPPGTPKKLQTVFPFLYHLKSETGITLLNPNKIFLDRSIMDSGELYWDGYHLTELGQRILAEWVALEYAKK